MIPKLKHMQYVILHLLKSGDKSRKMLCQLLDLYSKTAFYKLMKVLERSNYIKTSQTREKYYSITPTGLVELKCVRAFYKVMESK